MLITALSLLLAAQPGAAAPATRTSTAPAVAISTSAILKLTEESPRVRGIHITSWGAGSARERARLLKHISGTVINTVVVAVKETDGHVYIPGVTKAEEYGSYKGAIPKPEEMLKDFKGAGLYTIARIVVFKDQVLPKKRPDLAVRTPGGGLWKSHNGATWLDPYNRKVWDYTLDIAERCAKLGFDEIQFDYLRYPSEGDTKLCRYSKPHTPTTAIRNLGEFLAYAHTRLAGYNVKVSADVFGLTTSAKTDMGIGQDLATLASGADYIYPMMYPSHYAPGEYRLKNPNAAPYAVIDHGLKDALRRLGPHYARLRPYLQDFSLFGVHYGPEQVRAQIIAARRNMLNSWVLWNPANKYTWSALTPHSYRAFVDPQFPYDWHETKPAASMQ